MSEGDPRNLPRSAGPGASQGRSDSSLTLIIPVYNEADNFPRLWEELTRSVRTPFRALVIYDFDADNTIPAVQNIINAGEKRLQLLKNSVKCGVVGAIRTGLNAVLAGPILILMADLSDDLRIIDQMVAVYGQGYDVVVGSRYMKGGQIQGGPVLKKTLSRLAGVSLYYLRGLPTHDATNAFKIYDAIMLHGMNLESQRGFELNLELTVKAFLTGHPIAEIPSEWRDRIAGESRFRMWKWLPYYLWWYLFAFRPRKVKSTL